MKPKRHPLLILSCVTLLFTAILVGLVGYWLFYPDNVVVVTNPNTIKVDKTVYYAGDRITYTFSYCKTRPIVAEVSRALVDDFRTLYDMKQSDLPIGCHTISTNELTIPNFEPSGTYHLNISAVYPINPLRDYTVLMRTVDFKVIQIK